jgi:phage baseplate assembly protein W
MAGPARSFLGRGWSFPPRFDVALDGQGRAAGAGALTMVSDDLDIHESLRVLFSTFRGERLLQPEYGLGLAGDVDMPLNATRLGALRSKIEHAVLFFEPRIKLRKVTLDAAQAADGVLEIHLDYDIPAINSRSNMVYPLYLKEGTNVRMP